MKLSLPTSIKLSVNKIKGFTLIELLVVIAIIAVLSVIGIAIFTGQQKNARDARRRGDIESIAQAMEANYGKTTAGRYDPLVTTMFSSGVIPVDPTNTNTTPTEGACPGVCKYCVYQGGTQQTASACLSTNVNVVAVNMPVGGSTNTYWMVCANLETSATPFCRGNAQ